MSRSLSDQAYDILEEWIVTLKLKPGSVISETEIAERIQIGRTPVREALLKLSHEHLVESIPRKGIVVSDANVTDQIALLETRRSLERIIAARSARRSTPEQKKRFQELASKMKLAAQRADMTAFIKVDHEFDKLLAEACRNPFAAEACAPLRAHCRRFWMMHHQNEDMSRSAKFHADIMRAIADGSEKTAAAASDDLMDYLDKLAKSTIDK